MRSLLVAIGLLLLISAEAFADIREYLGRTVADVRVEVGGVLYSDASVLQLIETRVGEPLSMERVRESIDHLVGLGRFEDIRVYAEPSTARTNSVVMRWVLVPVQRIARIELEGRAAFSSETLRQQIADQVGALPVTSQIDAIVQALTAFYSQRGYRRPRFSPDLRAGDAPELVTLHLHIDPGPRAAIASADVRGDPGQPTPAVVATLALERGRPYDRPDLDARVAEFETSLRELGYYEANVNVTESFGDDGTTAHLIVEIDRGPRVRVVFAGDPLPENRRDTLVPIRQERSVDLDLLEDASRNIEGFLRQQGYRSAEVRYVREEAAGEMVLTFTVSRGPLHRLASLNVTGNNEMPRDTIAPLLALQPGEPFAENRVAAVAAAVTELYRVRGFARATVKPDVQVLPPLREAGQEVRPVAVRLIVNEGLPTTIGTVQITGNAAVDEDKVRSLLALTSGRPFYRPQLDADRDAVERMYRNQGFRNVRVEPQSTLSADGRTLDVVWNIAEGSRTVVDRVLVSGNVHTSADLIRSEVSLQPGNALSDDALIASQRALAALGLFRRVRIIELPHSASATHDVLIEVEEAPANTIDYGGGLEVGRRLRTGTDSQAEERIDVAPRFFFQVTRRNLRGKNRSITLFTRASLRPRDPGTDAEPGDEGGYGFNEYRLLGTFREPRVFGRPGDLQLTGFIEQAIRSSFNFNRRGVRLGFSRQLASSLTISSHYSFDHTRVFDVQIAPEDQLLIDRLFPQVRLSTVTGSLLRDTRNDVIDPGRGTLSGIETTVAARALGSEVGFAKTSLQGFVYRRLPGAPRITLAAGLRVGIAVGFERILEDGTVVDDVPASERFFAGGNSTVRGFVLDRLGAEETLNEDGFPEGGAGLVVGNVELRSAYWKGLGAVGFFDTGNVFQYATDISLSDLRPAAGVGLRYRSPLGPLRVDVGFNLDRQFLPTGERERGTVFHLSLGQAF